jgi:Family of unknown function (DUF5677)
MADAALYRQIVDVLLAEHEKSTPPQPRDEDIAAKLSVTWCLYCQVHRLARASILLADNGMGQEGIVLNRVMLEHTIVLHWVIARGDDGIEAVRANQSKQMRRWLGKTRNTALEVLPEIAGEITASFDGIDEAKATGFFSDVCRQVGCEDLYAGLRDLEPDGPSVTRHEQHLHRPGLRRSPARARPRPLIHHHARRALPNLGTAGPRPPPARPGPRGRTPGPGHRDPGNPRPARLPSPSLATGQSFPAKAKPWVPSRPASNGRIRRLISTRDPNRVAHHDVRQVF